MKKIIYSFLVAFGFATTFFLFELLIRKESIMYSSIGALIVFCLPLLVIAIIILIDKKAKK